MGLFNFSGIKDAVSGVKAKISELDADISTLEKQRNKMVSLPLTYEDFADWVICRYDQLSAGFGAEVKREMMSTGTSMQSFYMIDRVGHETLDDFKAVFGGECLLSFEKPFANGSHLPMSDRAFFYVFKDVIKTGMRRMLDETVKPVWPKEVGLPRTERIPLIEKTEKKIAVLVAERDQLVADLSHVIS